MLEAVKPIRARIVVLTTYNVRNSRYVQCIYIPRQAPIPLAYFFCCEVTNCSIDYKVRGNFFSIFKEYFPALGYSRGPSALSLLCAD